MVEAAHVAKRGGFIPASAGSEIRTLSVREDEIGLVCRSPPSVEDRSLAPIRRQPMCGPGHARGALNCAADGQGDPDGVDALEILAAVERVPPFPDPAVFVEQLPAVGADVLRAAREAVSVGDVPHFGLGEVREDRLPSPPSCSACVSGPRVSC